MSQHLLRLTGQQVDPMQHREHERDDPVDLASDGRQEEGGHHQHRQPRRSHLHSPAQCLLRHQGLR